MKPIIKYSAVFLISAAGSLAGSGIYNSFLSSSAFKRTSVQTPITRVNMAGGISSPENFTTAAESAVPTVVHVKTTYARRMGNQFVDPFQFFWGQPSPQQAPQAQSTGSGVIISEDGYIVTNNHVIEDAESVEVTLDDKRTFTAKVIGADPSTDLALLKVDEKGLPFSVYGNSDDVKVGEWVLAVGNPFNLTSTVTAGIVSAKARNIHILPDQNNKQYPHR